MGGRMTLEFEVDVGYLTDGGIKDMPTWVKLNDEDGERISTVYVNTSSYWHVVDENAKLRELVKDMFGGYKGAVEMLPSSYSKNVTEMAVMHISDRMRELGMEVD